MTDSSSAAKASRPEACPFCKGKVISTLAKVITTSTTWRCRECDRTWTIASLRAALPRPR